MDERCDESILGGNKCLCWDLGVTDGDCSLMGASPPKISNGSNLSGVTSMALPSPALDRVASMVRRKVITEVLMGREIEDKKDNGGPISILRTGFGPVHLLFQPTLTL